MSPQVKVIVRWLQYFAAHLAGFGGAAIALSYVLSGRREEALNATLAALAGFGLMVHPNSLAPPNAQ